MPPQRRKSGPVGSPRRRPKIAGSSRARSSDPSNDNPVTPTTPAETTPVETPPVETTTAGTRAAETPAADAPAPEPPQSGAGRTEATAEPADRTSDTDGTSDDDRDGAAAVTLAKSDEASADRGKADETAPVTRVSATASPAVPGGAGTRSRRAPLMLGVAAAVLAAVALVAAFRPGTSVSNEAWVDAAPTREVTDAAKQAIEAMHGYNYETIDEDFAEIRSLLTPERLEEFDATAEVTKQAAIQTHTVTEVNVLHIGTSVLDDTQAEVAAYINVSATGDGIAQGSAQAPVLVRMEKADGKWLVSEIRDR